MLIKQSAKSRILREIVRGRDKTLHSTKSDIMHLINGQKSLTFIIKVIIINFYVNQLKLNFFNICLINKLFEQNILILYNSRFIQWLVNIFFLDCFIEAFISG